MSKYDKIKTEEVEIHELANLTPTMTEVEFKSLKQSINENGQQMPCLGFQAGRNRQEP